MSATPPSPDPYPARSAGRYPVTPDGRYFLVRGRLWRMADPSLDPDQRQTHVNALMSARRAVGAALRRADQATEALARARVDEAKRALGERGPVWWTDGAPDLNRQLVRKTDYALWAATVAAVPGASSKP